ETYTSFYMRYLKKNYNLRLEGDRIQYIEDVLKQLAMIESPVEREYYLKELSDEFDISLDTLKNEIHVNQQKMTSPEDKRKKSRYTNKASSFYQQRSCFPHFIMQKDNLLHICCRICPLLIRCKRN